MAVKTRFSDEEFVEILANYRLGEYIGSQPIDAGTVQTNFALQTTRGKFIFRYYENRSIESARFESNLINYLKARKYPCPAPYKNTKGQYVGTFHGKPFVIFEFIEGQHLENLSKAQKDQVIQRVADLQNLTSKYRPLGRQQRLNYDPAHCLALAHQTAQTIDTANAQAKLKWYKDEVSKLDLPGSLPKGICHCDFHYANILFKDGEFVALIDFDDANYTYLTYDLALLMRPFLPSFEWDTWRQFEAGENILDFSEAKSLVMEYSKYRPLSPMERRHLFDVCKLTVLFDGIWYFERGDVSDFFERRKIDAFNQLGRDRFYERLF